MASKTSENIVFYNLDSIIKEYHVYQDIWSPKLLEDLDAAPEQNNIVDKYAVCVLRAGKVVGHLMKGESGRFAKTIFYFLRADKQNS